MTTLEQEITHIEEEIRDLKTTAPRGLGTIRFFREISAPIEKLNTYSIDINVTITIANDEPLPAFLTINTPLGNVPVPTTAGQYTYTYPFGRMSGTAFDVRGVVIATCSAKIANMAVEVI